MKRIILFLLFIPVWLPAQPVPAGTVFNTRNTPVHDPVLIREKDTYYLFCTGNGIGVYSSRNLQQWRREAPVFDKAPDWAVKTIPGFKGHIWAPDISFYNGKYYLYYAVSAFGKNTSCIGVAVNATLDPKSPDYKWEDKGKVLQSVPGRDMWNAIDPNLVVDESGTPWLSFGSFWEGIKLLKMDKDLQSPAQPEEWYTIARRPRDFATPDTSAGNGSIEAPFIFRKGPYYYLFVSRDACCQGEKSTYKVVVGRSKKVQGPYLDKQQAPLQLDGGSIVAQGDRVDWYALGHNAVFSEQGKDYLVMHGYDAKDRGRSKLIVEEMTWDEDGWPVVKKEHSLTR